MPSPVDLGQLKTNDWDRLLDLVERFERAWQNADAVDLAAFLPPPNDPLRPAALHELVKTDLEIRWRRGQGIKLESYLKMLPELGSADTLSPKLIHEEFRIRQQFGDRPALADYRQRFPSQFAHLQQLAGEEPTQARVPSTPPEAAFNTLADGSKEVLQFGGDYQLIKRLGCGTFAEVWLAEAPGGVRMAIKRLFQPMDTEEAQRELKSLELIKHLHHPYLLQNHAFWLKENRLHIAMDLADGTLRDRLKQCRAEGKDGVPLAELLTYFREAAEALDFLHKQKVLHRDVKPENILLLQGHAKVGDFGLARTNPSQRLTLTAVGTPAFMAPEVWHSQGHERSDQYSLALTYALLRHGKMALGGQNIVEVMTAHQSGTPDLEPLPPAEQQALLRALAKEPNQRYASCQEFLRALEKAVAPELRKTNPELFLPEPEVPSQSPGGPASDDFYQPTPPLPAPPPPPPTGWKWLAAGAVALFVLLAGAAVVWLSRPEPPAGSFTLVKPAALTLNPGSAQRLIIQVRRQNFDEPIRLTFLGLPPNLRIADIIIPPAAEHREVEVIAAPDVRQVGPVTLRAQAGEHEQEVPLTFALGEPVYSLPDNWQPAPQAELKNIGGRFYYDRIDLIRDGLRVRFLLIPPDRQRNLDTFYIMEDKVWVALYRTFDPAFNRMGHGEDRHPALGVPVGKAHLFAKALGGNLPWPPQWDKAAGRFEKGRGRGPFREPAPAVATTLASSFLINYPANLPWLIWNCQPGIAVNRQTPLPVGAAIYDISPFGCRDMSGNGLEWTRKITPRDVDDNRHVPLSNPVERDTVILRGWNYTESEPLSFEHHLDKPLRSGAGPGVGVYTDPDANYGFRVVLEP